jgi:hypothetical protein
MYESVSDEVVIPCLCAGPEYQHSYENLSSHELTEQLYTINALLYQVLKNLHLGSPGARALQGIQCDPPPTSVPLCPNLRLRRFKLHSFQRNQSTTAIRALSARDS